MTDIATLNRLSSTPVINVPRNFIVGEAHPDKFLAMDRAERFPFYVTRVANVERDVSYVNRILASRPASSLDGWIAVLPDQDYMGRVYGSPVNQPLENGKLYWVQNAYIVRYNDTDHMGDRNRAHHALSLVADSNGNPWPIAEDSIGALADDSVWIEVIPTTPPQVSDVRHPEADDVAADALPDVPTIDNNTLGGPFKGLGMAEENGLILKNPERVIGETYVVAFEQVRNPYLATWVKDGEGGKFLYHGYVSNYRDGIDFDLTQRQPSIEGEFTWVKLRLERAEPVEAEGRAETLRQELRAQQTSFSAFNEALNEMADNRGHCGEYDEIIEKLGMETRSKEWEVEVSAEITFTDSSPSSRIDSEISSAYGISIETTEIRVEGKVNVTVTVTAGSESSARDMVDSSEIEDRLDSFSDLEITDWSIQEVRRAD